MGDLLLSKNPCIGGIRECILSRMDNCERRMTLRYYMIAFCLLSTILLSACNPLKVPKSTTGHQMSASPTDVVPTNSEWKISDHPKANEDTPVSILIMDKNNTPIKSFDTVHE